VALSGLTLPTLTAADPPVEGEGSLDPLGTGAIAERIAEQLVPSVRARMGRVRFLTAMAVASIVTDEVGELLITDSRATPPLAFEWLLLEGYVRRNLTLPTGIPGTTKARGIRSSGGRLGASSYLKAPGVFGFNGVYKPLATGIQLVTDDLLPAAGAADLVAAWEKEQGLPGFLNGAPASAGRKVKDRLVTAVRAAVAAGGCVEPDRSLIWRELPHRLLPENPGAGEARLIRSWLSEHPIRGELIRLILPFELAPEDEVLSHVRGQASPELRIRIDAALTYERLASHLEVAFQALLWRSSQLGSSPLTPAAAAGLDAVVEASREIPDRYEAAFDALSLLELAIPLEEKLGPLAERMKPAQLADALIQHHNRIQAGKTPHGKRPWFEPHGAGFVVRVQYGVFEAPERRPFPHPMRVWSLQRFLEDTAA